MGLNNTLELPMELLETFLLLDWCGCCVELFAAGSSTGAGVAGFRAHRGRKRRQAARRLGEPVPRNPAAIWFVLLVSVALFFAGLVLFKHFGARNP